MNPRRTPPAPVEELEPGVFRIDHRFQGAPGVIASYLLAGANELALVETGPASTTEMLLRGVEQAGYRPEQITHLLLTHIHLDHAGAAGTLARRLPQARVYVHPVGAPHLIDPSRLLKSAARIYGDRMDALWGEVLPVPAERVTELADQQTLRVAGRTLTALDTPGHASHHLAFHDPASDAVYTGDVGGVRLHRAPYVRPPAVPPELDLVRWRASITRLRALNPRRLRLTHFGEFTDAAWHLDDLLSRLFFWGGWFGAQVEPGAEQVDADALARTLQGRGDAEIRQATDGDQELVEAYELATSYAMAATAYARYFRKLQ